MDSRGRSHEREKLLSISIDQISDVPMVSPDSFGMTTAIAVETLFSPITMPQGAYKLRKDSTCYIHAYIHNGGRPCRDKGLMELITCGPEDHYYDSKKWPSPVPRRNRATTKASEQ
jgi:hypothetical protein